MKKYNAQQVIALASQLSSCAETPTPSPSAVRRTHHVHAPLRGVGRRGRLEPVPLGGAIQTCSALCNRIGEQHRRGQIGVWNGNLGTAQLCGRK